MSFKRTLAVAVAALAATAAQAAPIRPVATVTVPWGDTIDPMNWSNLYDGGETQIFVRPAPSAGGFRRMWVRWEDKAAKHIGPMTYRSTISLEEFRCAEGQSRTIQGTLYGDNNMEKPLVPGMGQGQWSYETPGSFGDMLLKAACL